MKTLIHVALLSASIVSCHWEEVTILSGNNAVSVNLRLGQEKTVKVNGQTPGTFRIRFMDVNEGRCSPENCSSCYGGYAQAYFEIQSSTTHDSLVLKRISCVNVLTPTFDNPLVDHKDIRALRIGLAAISDKQRSKSTYTAQLLLTKL